MTAVETKAELTTNATQATQTPRGRTLLRLLALDRFSGVYCWLALVVLFSIWVPETFLTSSTIRTIGTNQSVTAVLALALILPLASGIYDLSVASTLGVSSVLVLRLLSEGAPLPLAVALSLLVGVIVGIANGIVVVGVGVDSFIATLGMSSILAALAFYITQGNQQIAEIGSPLLALGQGQTLGIPNPVLWALMVAAVLYYVTDWSTVGRYIYAVGGNIEAARLAGVRVKSIQFASLVVSGALASLAGVVLSAQIGSSSQSIGPPYLLPAFSAVLLGATQIKTNGRVNVWGTLVAVILLATGIYGLQLAGAPTYVSDLFNGVALIVAVSVSLRAKRNA